jgi:hypothetical protein
VNDDRNADPASPAEQLRLDEELAARFQHALASERLGVPLQAIVRQARRHRRRRSWRRYAQPQLAAALALIAVMVAAAVTVRAHDLARPQPPAVQPQPPASPSTRPKVTLIAAGSFRGGVQPWEAVVGSLLSRGELSNPNVSYARIQQDPAGRPATDPSTGKPMVGIRASVPNTNREGMQVQAVIRVRATKPGTMVVIRLSEWQGTRRVGGRDGRVTLLDTSWRQLTSDYRVLRSGSRVDLEILALALGPDQTLYIEPPVVTGS